MNNMSIIDILCELENIKKEKEGLNDSLSEKNSTLKAKYQKLQAEANSFSHSEGFLSIMQVLCRLNASKLEFDPKKEIILFMGKMPKPLKFDYENCFKIKDQAKSQMLAIKSGNPKDETNIYNLCVGYVTLISIVKSARLLYEEACNNVKKELNEDISKLDAKYTILENKLNDLKNNNLYEDKQSIYIAKKTIKFNADMKDLYGLSTSKFEEEINLSVGGCSSLFVTVTNSEKSTEKFHNFISGIFYKNFEKFSVGELQLACIEDSKLSSLPLSLLNKQLTTHDKAEVNLYSYSYSNVATDMDNASKTISSIFNEMNERKTIFGPTGAYKSIDEYNKANEYNKKVKILLLINGYKNMINSDKGLTQLLSLIKDGSKFGIYVIIFGVNEPMDLYNGDTEIIDFSSYGAKMLDFSDETIEFVSVKKEEIAKIRINAKKTIKQNEILYLDELFTKNIQVSNFAKEITIPVGLSEGKIYYFATSVDGSKSEYQSSPFTLIIGSTGMGKSAFIHTLILSGGMHYSPDELQFYIVDFKAKDDSAEFSCYLRKDDEENLYIPHIKYLSMKSKAENAYDVLNMINNLSDERAKLFSKVGAKDFIAYNSNETIKEKINRGELPAVPQIYFIIDEYITMLSGGVEGDDDAKVVLEKKFYEILSRVRTSGVGIIFSGQRCAFNSTTMGLIGNRIAFDPGNEGMLSSMFSFDIMSGEDSSVLYRKIGGKIGTAASVRKASSSNKEVVKTAFAGSHMGTRQLSIAKMIREKYSDPKYYTKQIIPGDDVLENGDNFLLEKNSKALTKDELITQSKEGELNVPLYIGLTSMTSEPVPIRYYLNKNHSCFIFAKQSKQELIEMNAGISFLRYLALNNNVPKDTCIILNDYVVEEYFTDAFGNIIDESDEVIHPLVDILKSNNMDKYIKVNNSAYDIVESIMNLEELRLDRFNALSKKKKIDRSPILFIINNATWLSKVDEYLKAEITLSEEVSEEETYDENLDYEVSEDELNDLFAEADNLFDDGLSDVFSNITNDEVNLDDVKVEVVDKQKKNYSKSSIYNALNNLILDGNKQNIYVIYACDDHESLKTVTKQQLDSKFTTEKFNVIYGSFEVSKFNDSSKDKNPDCCFKVPEQVKVRLYDYSNNAKKYWNNLKDLFERGK